MIKYLIFYCLVNKLMNVYSLRKEYKVLSGDLRRLRIGEWEEII